MKQPKSGNQEAIVSERRPSIPSLARANARLQHLQRLAAALVGAITTGQVMDAIIDEGLTTLEASAGSICLLSEDGAEICVARALGYPQDLLDTFSRFPTDALFPIQGVARRKV